MIYKSYDTIPIKLYLKIEQLEDVSLLSSKKTDKNLTEIWNNIVKERKESNPTKDKNKVLDISKNMQYWSARYEATKLSVFVLLKEFEVTKKRDQTQIDLLKSYGYKLHLNNFVNDLNQIEKENKALIRKINNLKNKLPKEEETKNKTTLDVVIMSYASVTKSGFIDTNKLTASQYDALIYNGNKMIENLSKNTK